MLEKHSMSLEIGAQYLLILSDFLLDSHDHHHDHDHNLHDPFTHSSFPAVGRTLHQQKVVASVNIDEAGEKRRPLVA